MGERIGRKPDNKNETEKTKEETGCYKIRQGFGVNTGTVGVVAPVAEVTCYRG